MAIVSVQNQFGGTDMLGGINLVNFALICLAALIGLYIQWRRWDVIRFWTKFATLGALMAAAAVVFSILRFARPPHLLVEHGPLIILADLIILTVGLVTMYLITPNRWRFGLERGRPSIETYGCGGVVLITLVVLAITFGLSFPTIEALIQFLLDLDLRPLAWLYVPIAILLTFWVFAFGVSLFGAFSTTLTLALMLYSIATTHGLHAIPVWETAFDVLGISSPAMKFVTLLVTMIAGAIDWSRVVMLDVKTGQLTIRILLKRDAEGALELPPHAAAFEPR